MLNKSRSWKRSLGISVSLLALSLAFRHLFCRSTAFSDFSNENPPRAKDREGVCDLFTGEWIPDSAGPYYTNKTCSFIVDHQNCLKNGRPDTGYLYWRWKPRDCDLHRLQPRKFLETMRNKRWGFIGDSISRNHVQSLLCILSQVEEAVEVFHDESYRSRRWIFPIHNLTISALWSPLLAKAAISDDDNGVSSAEIELHLDVLDEKWTAQSTALDYMVISAGPWFSKPAIYYEKKTILGCHRCQISRNLTELRIDFAFRRVIRNVFHHIAGSHHDGTVFYRTVAPPHFEGGEWDGGGKCGRREPAKEGELKMDGVSRSVHEIEEEEFRKALGLAAENGVDLRRFDVTSLALSRPDGHPGLYRFSQPLPGGENTEIVHDCLHWCVPGPIDHWSHVLFEMVLYG